MASKNQTNDLAVQPPLVEEEVIGPETGPVVPVYPVEFVVDYRGVLTNEQFYTKGTVVEFHDADTAAALIRDGRVVAKE